MGKPGPTPSVTVEETLNVFEDRGRPCDPLTATEVAEELDCTRRTAHRKLRTLVEESEIETKKVGARSRVWWRPLAAQSASDITGHGAASDQLGEFIEAVEDYAIFMLDPDGYVASWNEGAERIKGYEEDEIVGEHFSTFYPDGDVEAGVPTQNLEAAADAGRLEDEGWRRREDGTEFWASVTITAIRDEAGSLRGFTKVTRDLTERKRAEDEHRLYRSVSSAIARAESLAGGLEDAVAEVCGLTDWEYAEVWGPSDGPSYRLSSTYAPSGTLAAFADASVSFSFDHDEGLVGRVVERKEPVWLHNVTTIDEDHFARNDLAAEAGLKTVLAAPVVSDGDVAAVLLFAMSDAKEIDERLLETVGSVATELGGLVSRRRAQEALDREREFLDRVLEVSPVGVMVLDDEGEVERVNGKARELFEIPADELEAYVPADRPVYDLEGEPVSLDEHPFAEALESGEPVYARELRIERPDGRDRWLSVSAEPIPGPDGSIDRVVTTGEDITGIREREQALQRERNVTERILETVPSSVVVVNRDGELVRMNERARDRLSLGGDEGDAFGDRPLYDAEGNTVPREERPSVRAFETGESVLDWEGQVDLPRGRVWLSVSAVPLGSDDAPDTVVVAANDITRLKQQARRLERRRDRLEAELAEVYQRVDDAFYALDENWRFTFVNESAAEILDRTEAELLGEGIWDVFPGAAEGVFADGFREAMATQEPRSFETYYDPLDIWVEVNAYPSETGLSVYFRDVTERIERERELEQYERIVETVEDGVYVLDDRSRFRAVNDAFAALTGYDRTDLVGEHASTVTDVENVDAVDRIAEDLESAGRTVRTVETTLNRPDDETVPVETRVSLFPLSDGATGRVGVVRDVSERRRRENRLQTLNDTAETFLRAESAEAVAETVVEAAKEVLDFPGVGLYRYDEDRDELYPAATATDAGFMELELPRVSPGEGSLTGHVFAAGEPRWFDDVHREPQTRVDFDAADMRSGVFAPMGTFGILIGGAREVGAFGDETRRLVQLLAANAEAAYERVERQRELEESEHRYRALVEHFPNGVVALFDDDLRFQLVEGSVFDDLEHHPQDLEGETLDELSALGLGADLAPNFRATLAGEEITFEVEVPERTMEVRNVPVLDDAGDVIYGLMMAQDVSDRVERERELEQYRAIVESVNDGVYTVDRTGTITRVNASYAQMVGRSREELIGMDAAALVAGDVADRAQELERELADGERGTATLEAEFDTGSRSTVVAEATFSLLPGEDDAYERVGVVRDVTDRKEREHELEQYETIVETVHDGVYVVDADYRFELVNDAYAEMVGRPKEELLGSHISTVVDEATVESGHRLRDQLVEGGDRNDTIEIDIETADGESISTEIRYGLIPAEEDEFQGTVGVVRDVTGRKERERELERALNLLERTEDIADVGGWEIDTDTREVFWTDHLFDILEFTVDEEPPLDEALDVYHPDDRATVEEAVEAALGTGEPFDVEVRFLVDGDDERWLRVQGVPERVDGDIVSLRGAAQDITERKEHEQELKRSETIIEESTDVNAILDPDGTFQYLTPSTAHVLGYDAGELTGEVGFDYIHPDDVDAAMAEFTNIVDDPAYRADTEFRFRHADGSWVWLEARGRNLLDDPDIGGIVAYTRDITDRKRYEKRLTETVEKLEESNERLEQFAYVASHDLQEPLRMVSSYLTLIEDRYAEDLDADGEEFIEYAVDGAERMREMIDDLLAYSRVDTQAEPLEPTDSEEVVGQALANLQVQIEENDAEVTVESLPTVIADENQLEQVFQNLVSNAIKYRGDAPPEIRIGVERRTETWTFRVADNGIGIDPDQTDRIFDVFDRLHSHDEYPGTGIGLALCQKIVDRHEGDIWVESEPGEGSTFYFTIPAVDGADDATRGSVSMGSGPEGSHE